MCVMGDGFDPWAEEERRSKSRLNGGAEEGAEILRAGPPLPYVCLLLPHPGRGL